MKDIRTVYLVGLNIALCAMVIGLAATISHLHSEQTLAAAVQSEKKVLDTSAFDSLHVIGSSALVIDATTHDIFYAKDIDVPRPLASLTKIMTAFTARSLFSTSTIVTITPDALSEEGDSGLNVGEKWNIENLLDFTLVVSSNDGARVIASVNNRSDFITEMNSIAQEKGLLTLRFTNETGLDKNGVYGGVGSAHDMAILFEDTLKAYPSLLEATKQPRITIGSLTTLHTGTNTDVAIPHIPNIIASKTGYTNAAGGNLIVAFDAGIGKPMIIVVLGSTEDGRFTDMRELASSTLAFMRDNPYY